ncbi:delta-aminolevulinic acid dehydratase [candidate division LCP-89 bacterium B3_LCP]|uniref:Delta-aminolevulinic acid dehydratase n=1 Tax=candidate division LCP-89 bacterium B3_LCP TaxID=2012998 RepID=A0A532UPI0_UNCL8|nr:MAG: delta-aminolevulinic acid dehydratase [candidate division LCP-89 bacterium B3_LCP]
MAFPTERPRRLRRTETLRRMVRETTLSTDDLIWPMFVKSKGKDEAIDAMPGVFRYNPSRAAEEASKAFAAGIPAVILFGIPDSKDALGSASWEEDGVIQQAVRKIKKAVPEMIVMADVCLCEYTDHGHCGVIKDGEVDNDATLDLLARQAVSFVKAGADVVAPSDMMDGRVGFIRDELDNSGFTDRAIMAYSVKYASSFYGPFREAAGSAPEFGDRKGYQMDPANEREAFREVELDLEEGADIIMVKPALAFLDVISSVRQITDLPIAAFNVSGEYSMVKAAANAGMIDERQIVMEILTGIKRAGADLILTYHARDVAGWLEGRR